MFPKHFRQLGFESFGHHQNIAHFFVDFARESRQKTDGWNSKFLLLPKMVMQNSGDGFRRVAGLAACLRRQGKLRA
jgi:hypothetical protein